MRGKLARAFTRNVSARIIPAHAGQTLPWLLRGSRRPDHPRTCGANRVVAHAAGLVVGSSPHMRGKPFNNALLELERRIIPAHAGQTNTFVFSLPACTDHPRTCGANGPFWYVVMFVSGSSPHMRGKLVVRSAIITSLRIIPAHAGQTPNASLRRFQPTDHPRTCGANPSIVAVLAAASGSSPHMRGKLASCHYDVTFRRIIPAHAGQTGGRVLGVLTAPDHPRTCGANASPVTSRVNSAGSSPHMRGKPLPRDPRQGPLRIIPAHAGQTTCFCGDSDLHKDHPRTCGANSETQKLTVQNIGSSPHMRGKHAVSIIPHVCERIIPAHAGQTP